MAPRRRRRASSAAPSSSTPPPAMPASAPLPCDLPNLPACQSCALRKIKCDSRRPACATCARNGAACLLQDPEGGPAVSRAYLQELEKKARRIDAGVPESRQSQAEEATPLTMVTAVSNESAALEETETSSTVVQGGGLSFMSLLFRNRGWPDLDAELGPFSGHARATETAATESHTLPSASVAHFLFQEYLGWSHIQSPFLLRRQVLDVYDRVFVSAPGQPPPKKHDLFRAFMILAIGSVIPFRKGSHQSHPMGYYLAAMKNWSSSLLANGLDTIQDLLLVCRFAIYHQIGTSIWEVIRLCMRLCVEKGLQKQQPGSPDLLAEQKRRRVFWSCYIMDRYSSVTLNRPFAVADRDIHVAFPVEADDDEIARAVLAPDLDTFCRQRLPVCPNEMSVLLLCVRLRQVSSNIQTQFAALTRTSSLSCDADESLFGTGRVYVMVEKMLRELEVWRLTCPVFDHPRCLFERQEWYDLLLARERINLIRKAIDFIPKRNGVPPKHMLDLCLESASQTILKYSDMFSRSLITYTRSYFQLLFTAGLSVLFCVSVGTGLDATKIFEVQKTMATCRDTLAAMVRRLPDAGRYLAVFEALKQNILMKLGGVIQNGPADSSPVPLNRAIEQNGRTNQVLSDQFATEETWNGHGTQAILEYCAAQQQQHDGGMDNYAATGAMALFGEQPADCLVDWSFLNGCGLWDVNTYVYGDPSDFHGGPDVMDGELSGIGVHQGSNLMNP